jgi:hypothetical protein
MWYQEIETETELAARCLFDFVLSLTTRMTRWPWREGKGHAGTELLSGNCKWLALDWHQRRRLNFLP